MRAIPEKNIGQIDPINHIIFIPPKKLMTHVIVYNNKYVKILIMSNYSMILSTHP